MSKATEQKGKKRSRKLALLAILAVYFVIMNISIAYALTAGSINTVNVNVNGGTSALGASAQYYTGSVSTSFTAPPAPSSATVDLNTLGFWLVTSVDVSVSFGTAPPNGQKYNIYVFLKNSANTVIASTADYATITGDGTTTTFNVTNVAILPPVFIWDVASAEVWIVPTP
ncbi:MAG: hypothetical protein F7B17_04215 [Desulfurococcales archaeon]|nr:hypothetical protein [Desulfurococcales archaeon]